MCNFFPESGPLIENVYTVMSFKAVSSSGYGCNVNGQVFSSLDTLTSFVSTHRHGRFFFLPKKGLKYFAVGNSGMDSFQSRTPDCLRDRIFFKGI